jgi:hypothetical protein
MMVITDTPVEWYPDLGLFVKREDLCCPGGPNFSKTRGVFAHIQDRREKVIGVLDTVHSQGGWAVARACKELHRKCMLYYPVRKGDEKQPLKPQQKKAKDLGATLVKLPAGRSFMLYHRARASLRTNAYMMPNALKLPESVVETAREVERTKIPSTIGAILVPASSATIAAGVCLGLQGRNYRGKIVVHLGYSRPHHAVLGYMKKMTGLKLLNVEIVDENYTYADVARPGMVAPFASNEYYDLKTFRWWCDVGRQEYTTALLWNIG